MACAEPVRHPMARKIIFLVLTSDVAPAVFTKVCGHFSQISLGGITVLFHWCVIISDLNPIHSTACLYVWYASQNKTVVNGFIVQPCPYYLALSPQAHERGTYSISQEICTRFCCALLCWGYTIVHNEFTRSIYPYSSGLLCWHWGNR